MLKIEINIFINFISSLNSITLSNRVKIYLSYLFPPVSHTAFGIPWRFHSFSYSHNFIQLKLQLRFITLTSRTFVVRIVASLFNNLIGGWHKTMLEHFFLEMLLQLLLSISPEWQKFNEFFILLLFLIWICLLVNICYCMMDFIMYQWCFWHKGLRDKRILHSLLFI